jgi:hypothetical protein
MKQKEIKRLACLVLTETNLKAGFLDSSLDLEALVESMVLDDSDHSGNWYLRPG